MSWHATTSTSFCHNFIFPFTIQAQVERVNFCLFRQLDTSNIFRLHLIFPQPNKIKIDQEVKKKEGAGNIQGPQQIFTDPISCRRFIGRDDSKIAALGPFQVLVPSSFGVGSDA
jgi:hypothetical protein